MTLTHPREDEKMPTCGKMCVGVVGLQQAQSMQQMSSLWGRLTYTTAAMAVENFTWSHNFLGMHHLLYACITVLSYLKQQSRDLNEGSYFMT